MDTERKINPEVGARIMESWQNPEHLRLRIQPRRGDVQYPVLSDLNDFIRRNGSAEKIVVLDFGAGSSPYKMYFPNADYRRADILATPDLRYRIEPDSRIDEQAEVFDLVLSTQVLEHVENVNAYLEESFRLLKNGGVLLVTTHGIWEEHGVPYDFQRWTEEGLKRDLKIAGYIDIDIYKITCGLRGALFLFISNLFSARAPLTQPSRFIFKAFRTVVSRLFPLAYRWLDKYWPEDKIVKADNSAGNAAFHIIIAAIARK
jgi:SAM-dependent methyltransferase